MPRRLEGGKLVVASHNPGKVREIAELLAPYGVEVASARDFGLPEPQESGASFRDNAEIKARAAATATGLPALADDSGLVVPALGGAPGVQSARWAGPERNFGAAMERLERELQGKAERGAHFVCALSVCWPDGVCETFEGRVDGRLVWPPRGTRGFGYDPVFRPDGFEVTFAEMDPAEKHAISHRARAFAKFAAACLGAGEER